MELKEQIRDFIDDNLNIYEDDLHFSDNDNIFDLGFVDSLFALKLVTFIEKEYAIKVENEDLSLTNFNSVDNIVDFIRAKLAVNSGGQ